MKRDHIIIAVLVIIVSITIYVNVTKPAKDLRYIDCNSTFDTTLISKEWTHGTYPQRVNDSLILVAYLKPLDKSVCETVQVKDYEPRLNPGNREVICSLGDLYPPFSIIKNSASDSLLVLKDGFKLYFQIPCDANEEDLKDDFYYRLRKLFD